jgi:NADH-quinone oxidoreductase subunit J
MTMVSMTGFSPVLLGRLLAQAAVPGSMAGGATGMGPGSTDLIAPVLILSLCAMAGLGTVMLLPGRHEAALHKIGGVIVAVAGLIFLALSPRLFFGEIRAGEIYFWIFSAIALVGALRVITHAQPVYSALYFVLTVFASAGLFVLLEAEFLAAALVLIYAGAILITYLFVIMLASQATASEGDAPTTAQVLGEYDKVSREPLAAAAIGFALMGVLLFVIFDKAGQLTAPIGTTAQPAAQSIPIAGIDGGTQELGLFLFRSQLVQLELAGLILTLAMVGAMVISRRHVLMDPSMATTKAPQKPEVMLGPGTPVDDNPHSIPVYGTENPRQKAYPET